MERKAPADTASGDEPAQKDAGGLTFARRVFRGAAWTVSASLGSRALGLAATLAITRFIAPDEYGEVTVAAVLVMTTQQLSTLGVGQYVIANPHAGRRAAFHATILTAIAAAVCFGAVLASADLITSLLGASGATVYLPGLLVAALLDRVAFMPERLLVRDLRFSALSGVRTTGEVVYSVAAVAFAVAGWGAGAIVWANIARSAARTVLFVLVTRRTDWLTPCRITVRQSLSLLRFGLPISFAQLSAFASRRWDNLLVARFFGPGPTGMYNLAYNLADVPAIQIGEQVGDVLFPSFARMPKERRREALVRSLSMLGLVVFPLAVGLGAVGPTLVTLLFDPRWQAVAPMLIVLSVLSVTRPVGWTIACYLQAQNRPHTVMWLEVVKVVVLLGFIATVGRLSPLWTCGAVGIAFAVHTAVCLFIVHRDDKIDLRDLLWSVAAPLLACAPLAAGVLLTRLWYFHFLRGDSVALGLSLEILGGSLCYALGAFLFARDPSRDFIVRLRDALPRRAGA